jgi:hypothetical protein
MLSQYKNIFGKPGTGAHSWRIFNIAIVDVLLTVLVGLAISYFFKINIGLAIGGFFLLGIALHRLFGVRTTIDKLLFPQD